MKMPTSTKPKFSKKKSISAAAGHALLRCFYHRGHTFLEAITAVAIVALVISVVGVNLFGMLERSRLNRDVADFARTLRLTAEQAITRGQELAVVIEVTDGYYTVYEANEKDIYDADEIEPLIERQSLDFSYIDDIEFEDGSRQYSGELILHADRVGWSSTVVFSLLGLKEQPRFVVCEKLTPRVTVSNQPLDLLLGQEDVSMTLPI